MSGGLNAVLSGDAAKATKKGTSEMSVGIGEFDEIVETLCSRKISREIMFLISVREKCKGDVLEE